MRLSRRTIIRTGILAAAAPALGRLGLPRRQARRGPAGNRGRAAMAAWPLAVRRAALPGGFQAFRLRQSERAQGRHGAACRRPARSTISTSWSSGVKGKIAAAARLAVRTLMIAARSTRSRPSTGSWPRPCAYPPDFSSVTYRLRAEAKWHDGKPVTPEDVIFSFEAFKRNSPLYSAYYRHVVKAEKTGEREVTFTFDTPGNRELPHIVGQLTVLPKHWWEGTDAVGQEARRHRDHARAAARQRPLPDQELRGRAQRRARAREGLLGQRPQRQGRNRQFRRDAIRIFPRLHRRARGLQGRSGRLADREQREELGHRLRFSGGARQPGRAGAVSDPQSRPHAGLRLQHAPGQVQGCPGAAGLRLSRSISRR